MHADVFSESNWCLIDNTLTSIHTSYYLISRMRYVQSSCVSAGRLNDVCYDYCQDLKLRWIPSYDIKISLCGEKKRNLIKIIQKHSFCHSPQWCWSTSGIFIDGTSVFTLSFLFSFKNIRLSGCWQAYKRRNWLLMVAPRVKTSEVLNIQLCDCLLMAQEDEELGSSWRYWKIRSQQTFMNFLRKGHQELYS